MDERTSLLAGQSVLKGLAAAHLEQLAACSSLAKFQPGQFMMESGKDADRFFILTKGRAALEVYTPQRGPRPIQEVGPGEILGTSWLVPPYRLEFDARAMEPTEAIHFHARDVRSLIEKDHELG